MQSFAARRLLTLGIAWVLLTSAACDGLLDENPNSILAPDDFYRTGGDAISAVAGVYEGLMHFYAWSWYLTDLASDDFLISPSAGGDMHQLSNYTFDEGLWVLNNAWADSYRTINRANAVLGRVPGISMDEAVKQLVLGEARFLRALAYFNLVRLWGDVPLFGTEIQSVTGARRGRTPATEVYNLIIADLKQAVVALPAKSNVRTGQATRGAAQGLLAKVHLHLGDWSDAARVAGEVIAGGEYALVDDWKENFQISRAHVNSESMFEIEYDHKRTWGSWFPLFALPAGLPGGDAYGLMTPAPDLLALFASYDARGQGGTYMTSPHTDALGRSYSWAVPNGPGIAKYFDQTSANNMSGRAWAQLDNNWIVLRYADVLLTYAEAVAEGGTPVPTISGIAALNAVRTRAGLEPLGTLTREAVRTERRREFVFEGHRWFDLSRWGILGPTFHAKSGTTVRNDRFLPIPRRELNLNPALEQNAGW